MNLVFLGLSSVLPFPRFVGLFAVLLFVMTSPGVATTQGLQDFVVNQVELSTNALLQKVESVISTRFDGLQKELASRQEEFSQSSLAAIKGIMYGHPLKFKRKGNELQYLFNEEIIECIVTAKDLISKGQQNEGKGHLNAALESLNKR